MCFTTWVCQFFSCFSGTLYFRAWPCLPTGMHFTSVSLQILLVPQLETWPIPIKSAAKLLGGSAGQAVADSARKLGPSSTLGHLSGSASGAQAKSILIAASESSFICSLQLLLVTGG